MNWDDFLEFLRKPESTQLKFFDKDPTPEQLATVMVAMANTEGGTIIIGIDQKNLHFFGSAFTEMQINLLAEGFQGQPVFYVHMITRGDKKIVGIQIQESDKKPVFFQGRSYIYTGADEKFFIVDDPFAVAPVSTPLGHQMPLWDTPGKSKLELVKTPRNSQTITSLNDRQKQVLVFLKTTVYIRNQIYREMFGISHKTAHIELTNLVENGLVVQEGAGRSTRYRLT